MCRVGLYRRKTDIMIVRKCRSDGEDKKFELIFRRGGGYLRQIALTFNTKRKKYEYYRNGFWEKQFIVTRNKITCLRTMSNSGLHSTDTERPDSTAKTACSSPVSLAIQWTCTKPYEGFEPTDCRLWYVLHTEWASRLISLGKHFQNMWNPWDGSYARNKDKNTILI